MIDELVARDEACQMFAEAWTLVDWVGMENGVAPTILWEGRDAAEPQPDEAFVRFSMTPVDSQQASLTDQSRSTKYSNIGIISVQSFAPLQWPDAYEVAEYVAIMAKRVYQGKASPNGMWFSNCRVIRIGPSGGWYQFNTIIDFQYNELR